MLFLKAEESSNNFSALRHFFETFLQERINMAIAEHLSIYTDTVLGGINKSLSLTEIGMAGLSRADDVPASYTSLPAFAEGTHPGIVIVDPSEYAVGTPEQQFTTRFVRACSGYIIKSPESTAFGLYHASPLPLIDLTEDDFIQLEVFAGGQATEIKGSESTNKAHILRKLRNKLGIEHTGTIEVSTLDPTDKSHPFHLALLPAINEVLIARNSHKDVLRYPAFQ